MEAIVKGQARGAVERPVQGSAAVRQRERAWQEL